MRICISSQNIAYKWSHTCTKQLSNIYIKNYRIYNYCKLSHIIILVQFIAHILQFIVYILHLLHTSNEYRTYVTIIAYIWETSHIQCTLSNNATFGTPYIIHWFITVSCEDTQLALEWWWLPHTNKDLLTFSYKQITSFTNLP